MQLDYEQELNPEQYDAVTAIEGPLLIIAGAGSGKTRVITFRAAYMLQKGIPQSSILALTFTNKAAKEMAERVRTVTGKKLPNLTVSTFHAFGVKILRKEIHRLGWRENYSIYDEVDRNQLIKDCARETGFKLETFDVNKAGMLFSDVKTERKNWEGVDDGYEKVFHEYQAALKAYNAVDFDDLIGLPVRIFQAFPEVREEYRDHYRYIMIDEFQDTSLQQYQLMRLLARDNVCVVGDDDQSIYSWRGANYQNIINFEKDWPRRKEVTLYRNYRSTTTILDAANSIIANNTNRKLKDLRSPNEGGAQIELLSPANELDEGEQIATIIREIKLKDKLRYDQFGVLIRTNNLTRYLEEAFLGANIPYKVTGGTSFFGRKEIKDIISYLRVIANPEDDVNLIRIVNVPRRGIGRRSVELLTDVAKSRGCSLRAAMEAVRGDPFIEFPDRTRQDVESFLGLLEMFREELLHRRNLAVKVRKLVDAIDYWGYLVNDNQHNDKAAKWKFLNVESLIKGIDTWEKDPDNLDPSLFAWLNRISLITRDDQEEDDTGKVNLMTIHAAKGLEFDVVFIAGCEDGIIPHARALEEGDGNVEEERRLFYVAVTRARQRLLISVCQQRRRNAMPVNCVPSPFLAEIPEHLTCWREPESELSEDEQAAVWQDVRKMFGKDAE
ncbi:MAG: AAA family ATPase [Spirochaetes bacterium GWD1_61_31]|nr:MAG: AAA family ATPase [Spirochaetes bacterium GWB1_60_80]OHD34376.1 MAG: AAA family ATPase [Spirochaetes bacterium GWC1_61_12]OHD41635.1 MAG: AAA family ATPase [Spirochaetes bacterium GWD1_61_31]OHD41674.1 MAG: AAA family ATPase [Spirochaetes bacterium GWE1_60_18]OHD60284.1 MAG: AAA family ATPase [Spirochaetes bacterium GWF1_60_12]HAP42918.1 AAA family ATPase [Spirochaetaceae bacterium]